MSASPLSSTRSPTRARKAPTTPSAPSSRTSAWWPFPTSASISSPRCTSPRRRPPPSSNLSTSRVLSRAQARVRVSATSSLRTSAARTPSCTLCAASTMKISCTSWPTRARTSPSTPWATLRPSTWSSSWQTLRWSTAASKRRRRWPRATRSSCTRSSSFPRWPSTSTRARARARSRFRPTTLSSSRPPIF